MSEQPGVPEMTHSSVATSSSSGGKRFRGVALAVAWRMLHHFFTNPSFLLPSVLFPLFFFTAFAGGLSRIQHAPGFSFPDGYTAFQYVFVLLQSAAFGGVFTGFSVAAEYEKGFARRLLLAAPNRLAIVAGYAIAAVTRALAIGSLITVVALIAGMKVSGGPVDLFGLAVLALIVSLVATLFSSGVAMRFRTLQAGPLMQLPVFLILFLAPVYVPLNLLSGLIKSIASINPVTPLVEGGRDLISGHTPQVGLMIAVLAGLLALFAIWAVRGLRKAEAVGG